MPATELNPAQALHTAARRYCDEEYLYWMNRYWPLVESGKDRCGPAYTPEALRLFPRYRVLEAIRIDVERFEPDDFEDLDHARELLILAGGTADSPFTRDPIGNTDAAAMAEEREAFCSYLQELSLDQLRHVPPLPYRRVLRDEEAKAVWARLRDRWAIGPWYWFPLSDCIVPNVTAFEDRAFEDNVDVGMLCQALRDRDVDHVWELREHGPMYVQDVSLLDPGYNGAEGYWSSEQMDWIIYASHESTITVGGWMLDEVKNAWPKWFQQVCDRP